MKTKIAAALAAMKEYGYFNLSPAEQALIDEVLE